MAKTSISLKNTICEFRPRVVSKIRKITVKLNVAYKLKIKSKCINFNARFNDFNTRISIDWSHASMFSKEFSEISIN